MTRAEKIRRVEGLLEIYWRDKQSFDDWLGVRVRVHATKMLATELCEPEIADLCDSAYEQADARVKLALSE